jgi:GNAT superfamily N-acetyltransferase
MDQPGAVAGTQLRAARAGDGAGVAAVFGAARARMTYLPSLHSAEEHVAFFSERVLPTSSVEVADLPDGGIVGFCVVKDGWVEHLYVHPLQQGKGIGSALLHRAMTQQPDGLTLWVFEENHGARRLYERFGFVVVERTDGSGNEERQPDLRMQWG